MTLAFIDPSWAIPMNTALLIVYAVLNRRFQRRIDRKADTIRKEVVDVKFKCGADRREEDTECLEVVRQSPYLTPDPSGPHRRWFDYPKDPPRLRDTEE